MGEKLKAWQASLEKWLSDHQESLDWVTDKLEQVSDRMTWKRWAVVSAAALVVLLGSCMLHTFIIFVMMDDQRLELEETLRREKQQARN